MTAFLFCMAGTSFTHIKNSEIPINRYKKLQTGPNSQLGGLKKGLLRLACHVGMFGVVKKDPTPAAENVTRIEINNLIAVFFLFIIFL